MTTGAKHDGQGAVPARRFHRVAVVMGGDSSEREISLRSGEAVVQGLRAAGYSVEPVTIGDRLGSLPTQTEAVFIALHGAYGEDGGIQSELDRRAIPYIGAGAVASRLAFDKIESKRIFDQHGIPTAPWRLLRAGDTRMALSPPLVIKPPCQGSSIGVQWVANAAEWPAALTAARAYGEDLLVEQYIPGGEWTVGLLDDETFPVVAVESPGDRYDCNAKYTPGCCVYRVIPVQGDSDSDVAETCRIWARRVLDAVGGRGVGRVDFRISPQNQPFVLELNTIPGFTPTSLLPKAAAAAGTAFPDLCRRILERAAFDRAPPGSGA